MSDRIMFTDIIASDGAALSAELHAMRQTLFPPVSKKTLRSFSSTEAARLLGVADAYLRQLSLSHKGPQPAIIGGKRSYTLAQINEMRTVLDEGAKSKRYSPRRATADHCQVMAVVNFKGGPARRRRRRILRSISRSMAIGCWRSISIRKRR